MKTLIMIGAYVALVITMTLTSCKKTETDPEITPEARKSISSSPIIDQRYQGTFDTEDRPKMVRGHIQNNLQEDVSYAAVSMYLVSDSSKVGGVNADFDGDFAIDSIYAGNYYLKITASGYPVKYVEVCIPLSEDTLYEVGTITLLPE